MWTDKDMQKKVKLQWSWFILLLLGLGLSLCSPSSVSATDKIILKNNSVIEGKIIKDERNQIVVEIQEGKAFLTILRSNIARIILEKPEIFASAEAFFEKGNYAEAIRLYKQVIREYSNYDWAQKALFQMGRAYMKLKNWSQARESFQKYLKTYPDAEVSDEVNLYLAQILTQQGQYGKAAAFYENILKMEDKEDLQVQAQYGLAEIYMAKQEYEAALMAYLRVLVVFYNHSQWVPQAMFKAGLCYEKLNDIARAKQIYEEIRTDYPKTKHAMLAKKKISSLPQKGNDTERQED